jgi:cyanosortase A-associated protein
MYWKTFRIPFLIFMFSTGVFVLGIKSLFPNLGNPKNRPFVLFKKVPLSQWKMISSQALPVNTEKYPDLLSQRNYQYAKNGINLNIKMRYLQNFYPADVTIFTSTASSITTASIVRHKEAIGYYGVGVDKKNAYLSSCINPRGGSTFTHAQYRENRYLKDISFSRLLPVLRGQEALIDKRCLLTHLSIPLQHSSPESSYQILEQAWVSWYKWWQPRFPQP